MRIRRKSSFISASPSSSFSSSPSSASSNSSSSITTNNSLASSTDSSSSNPPVFSPFSSTLTHPNRCQGLDLLVKAIHLVTAGSVVGVPYIQRRVVRRRKAALKFNGLSLTRSDVPNEDQMRSRTRSMSKRQSKAMEFPAKYQDSVIQPWKPKTRRLRSSKIGDELCP